MKKALVLFFILFITACCIAQIPSSGNVLWLQADKGIYIDNGATPAVNGQWIQQWEDQSGSGNHFTQITLGRRPVFVTNVLCSRPVIRFQIGRGTYLQSPFKLSGAKSVFIVFVLPSLSNSAGTLLSIKGNSNSYTEIVGTDFSGYNPVSYIADLPGSVSGGFTVNSMGNTAAFSNSGNMVTMVYDGGTNTAASSYSAKYDAAATAVNTASGRFGRLLNDSTTIGARAPQQNINYLDGDIAEMIVYNRALSSAEISQVENYLSAKYGLLGSCITLAAHPLTFTATLKNNTAQLTWSTATPGAVQNFIVEHSTNKLNWETIAMILPVTTAEKQYQFLHNHLAAGANYYRIKITRNNGSVYYSETKKLDLPVANNNTVSVFPNPASDYIIISTAKKELLNVSLLNDKGQLIKSIKAYSNSRLSLSGLPRGIYFINAMAAGKSTAAKFLKQ